MGIRYYKPTTPGRRGGTVSDFAEITDRKKKPEKSLLRPKPKKGGRNNQGIVCSRFRGGGHKQKYRVIDFKRRKDGIWATVAGIAYDPNRTCRIALLQYDDGETAYILGAAAKVALRAGGIRAAPLASWPRAARPARSGNRRTRRSSGGGVPVRTMPRNNGDNWPICGATCKLIATPLPERWGAEGLKKDM